MSATLSLPAVMKMGLRWSVSRCLGGADAKANDDSVLLAKAILQTMVELKMRRPTNGTRVEWHLARSAVDRNTRDALCMWHSARKLLDSAFSSSGSRC